ncbi:MAG: hypothetical protein CMP61_08685 [Flavobacteriales bacterium]|nr:hypothetical protein [Flavobacteriales bacterium]
MDGNPINLTDVGGDRTYDKVYSDDDYTYGEYTENGEVFRDIFDRNGGYIYTQIQSQSTGDWFDFGMVSNVVSTYPVKVKVEWTDTDPTDYAAIGEALFEVAMGFTPAGIYYDARDLYQAIESGDGLAITIALAGFIPGGDILKAGKKMADAMGTAAKKIADQATTIAKKTQKQVRKGVNHLNEKAKKVIGGKKTKKKIGSAEDVGEVVQVGTAKSINKSQGELNCVDCAIATYDLFKNKKLREALGDDLAEGQMGDYVRTLYDYFPNGDFLEDVIEVDEVLSIASRRLKTKGDGLILIGSFRNGPRNGANGHAFNIVRTGNKNVRLRFFDSQTGKRYSKSDLENVFREFEIFDPTAN